MIETDTSDCLRMTIRYLEKLMSDKLILTSNEFNHVKKYISYLGFY